MTAGREEIKERIGRIMGRVAEAADRSGRDPAWVRLMGVTKTVPPEAVRHAYDAGLRLFGENYVQEALEKIDRLPPEAEWHMIGHLQSNKARRAATAFSMIQTVDRPSLAAELNKAGILLGRKIPALIEVNLGDEDTKAGCATEEAVTLASRASEWPGVEFRGLMALPPYCEDPEESRQYFRALAGLARRISSLGIDGVEMCELSMGMSHDFEVAVEEGATIVRVGTAIFGART